VELYIWDYFRDEWSDGKGQSAQNRYMDNWAGNRDGYLRGNIQEDLEDFIGSYNEITLLLYAERPADRSFHDYVSIAVTTVNDIPSSPMITGQTDGKPGTPYTYTFESSEPDGEDVSYYIDWGDGTITDWTDYQNPDTEYSEQHTWSTQETFEIKAKAKDENGAESEWSTLQVTIPRNKALFNRPILSRILDYFPNVLNILKLVEKLQ
jgi:hypothetical protein